MPLIFDVESVGPSSTNGVVVARAPLGQNTVVVAVVAVFQGGGPAQINLVSGPAPESGVVAANGVTAVAGNQVFYTDAGQTLATPEVVYSFTAPTTAVYALNTELTLRVVTTGTGAANLKVVVYTTADGLLPYTPPPTVETSFNPIGYQPQIFYPFGMPYQPLGQWLAFDPTAGAYTYTISPGFTLGSLYFPELSSPVQIFEGSGYTSPAQPFYTTSSGGNEVVPLPSGLTSVTLYAPLLAGAIMPFFVTSSIFDPEKNTPDAGAVGSVTASLPLLSSGGPNPNISLPYPLPVSYGGTGTATPSLVQGSNIQITGTWPNQKITATITATYVSAVNAALPLTSSGGLTPTIALNTPLAVAFGGTGSTNPGLVNGTGIVVTGVWPNQTVSLASSTQPIYNYNSSSYLSNGYIVSGNATTSTGGSITLTSNYPNAILSAVATATGGTPYVITATIAGKNVTFTAYTLPGVATSGVPFSFELTGN
jgi:hypothetical protein